MNITIRELNDVTVLSFEGMIDTNTSPAAEAQLTDVMACFAKHGLEHLVSIIGTPVPCHLLSISDGSRHL